MFAMAIAASGRLCLTCLACDSVSAGRIRLRGFSMTDGAGDGFGYKIVRMGYLGDIGVATGAGVAGMA